ncbi:hypothetical protein HOY80DRAFT_316978 [Tuber brumale]|nr:hypothetical protein HOY80DRAFT_316978 [Tuber brumale]
MHVKRQFVQPMVSPSNFSVFGTHFIPYPSQPFLGGVFFFSTLEVSSEPAYTFFYCLGRIFFTLIPNLRYRTQILLLHPLLPTTPPSPERPPQPLSSVTFPEGPGSAFFFFFFFLFLFFFFFFFFFCFFPFCSMCARERVRVSESVLTCDLVLRKAVPQ